MYQRSPFTLERSSLGINKILIQSKKFYFLEKIPFPLSRFIYIKWKKTPHLALADNKETNTAAQN